MADYFDHPFHFDERGRTAETGEDDHVRDLIHQVLFTAPGERVNRPDFGCGLRRMIFTPNSGAAAAATRMLVHGALQRWLDAVIQVERVDVRDDEEILRVTVVYTARRTGERTEADFTSTGLG